MSRRGKTLVGAVLAVVVVIVIAVVVVPRFGQDDGFEGVEINLLTRPGPVIAGRLEERGAEFTELTGATINVSTVPFADLFQKLLTDWATGTNSIDVGVFASGWAVELADGGLLADLTDFVEADENIAIDDIAPYFREFNQKIEGRTRLITIDGDFQMVYYRTDVLDDLGLQPPRTWDEYIDVAAAAHDRDINGDGVNDFGSCIFKKRNAQSYFAIMSVAAGYIQTQGTGEGIFFDSDTMEPLINNEAFGEALRVYKATGEFGPPDELNHDIGDTRDLMLSGRCALMIDWGDIGPLSIDETTSSIKDKVGAVVMPGSTRVLDRASGRLVDCDAARCPHAVDGVNHAPFAAFGGWSGAINAAADERVIAAAYAFLSYMNSPEQSNFDVTQGWTGYNPYRISQVSSTDQWVEAGFSEDSAENYLGAILDSLNSPNMASDLRIPGTQQYTAVVLDRELSRFLADEITAEQAMANIAEGWQEITDEFDRDRQKTLYQASLGITNAS